jgi:hypothetical protein
LPRRVRTPYPTREPRSSFVYRDVDAAAKLDVGQTIRLGTIARQRALAWRTRIRCEIVLGDVAFEQ